MNAVNDKDFFHLKIHTQYSICEGALRTSDLGKYCKENRVKAVGLCDSYNLCGALDFSESVSKSKTQPIIGTQINIEFKGELRDYQLPIVDAYMKVAEEKGGGLLELHTGAGKTVCGLRIISKIKRKTLIIVHKEFLLRQWVERIEQFLPNANCL